MIGKDCTGIEYCAFELSQLQNTALSATEQTMLWDFNGK